MLDKVEIAHVEGPQFAAGFESNAIASRAYVAKRRKYVWVRNIAQAYVPVREKYLIRLLHADDENIKRT